MTTKTVDRSQSELVKKLKSLAQHAHKWRTRDMGIADSYHHQYWCMAYFGIECGLLVPGEAEKLYVEAGK